MRGFSFWTRKNKELAGVGGEEDFRKAAEHKQSGKLYIVYMQNLTCIKLICTRRRDRFYCIHSFVLQIEKGYLVSILFYQFC